MKFFGKIPFYKRTLAAVVLALACASPSLMATESPWGIRNLILTQEIRHWSASEFQSEFEDHGVGLGAFWLLWRTVEPSPNSFDWTDLDDAMDRVESIGADPTIVFFLNSNWEEAGGFCQAGRVANPSGCPWGATGPSDLNWNATPSWPTPEGGYSAHVYDVAYRIAERIAQRGVSDHVYMRFHNESWDSWALGTPQNGQVTSQMNTNMKNYLLTYLTYRRAIEDVEARFDDIEFSVSHGSLPRYRLLGLVLYNMGLDNTDPLFRSAIASVLASYTERVQNSLKYRGVPNPPINNWYEVVNYAAPTTDKNLRADLWLVRFLQWTIQGYFDFVTWHPHGKPVWEAWEKNYLQNIFDMYGLEEIEWQAAEAAYENLAGPYWSMSHIVETPTFDNFVMEEYARKWCTMLAIDSSFASPVIGGPHPRYVGLYKPVNPQVGLPWIEEFPANRAFVNLSNLIGQPDSTVTLRADSIAHYRFDKTNDMYVVDSVWRQAMFDNETGKEQITITAPDGYLNGRIENALGEPLAPYTADSSITLLVGQEPFFIIWTP